MTTIDSPQTARAAVTAMHALAFATDPADRGGITDAAAWTVSALNSALGLAYPGVKAGPQLPLSSAQVAREVASRVFHFLVNDWRRRIQTDGGDAAQADAVSVASDVAFALCRVLAADANRQAVAS